MLEVPREQYLRCARLRTEVCDAFADVEISAERAAEILPEQGVPDAFVEAALDIHEAEQFQPTMLGPASMRVADALQEDQVQAEAENEAREEDTGLLTRLVTYIKEHKALPALSPDALTGFSAADPQKGAHNKRAKDATILLLPLFPCGDRGGL